MEISLNNLLNKTVKTTGSKVLDTERSNFLLEINKVKCDLSDAYNNFDFISDPLMIDYYTYQIKAYETKFEYLMKKAKTMGIGNL